MRYIKLAIGVALIGGVLAAGLRYAALRATADARFKGGSAQRIFDPSRNALDDLHSAESQAAAEHKNVLMDVGGNWCPSCILLDRRLRTDNTLKALLSSSYVVLHVNWSSDNRNESVLSKYPEAHGYPALYVLAPDGKLLKAEDTSELEEPTQAGSGYSQASLATFLAKYAARR